MYSPEFVDHLVFRVSDLEKTERFYSVLLNEPNKAADYIMYLAGNTRLFFTVADPPRGLHDKEQVGLNHMALGVRTLEELNMIQQRLDDGGIAHSGIGMWQDGVTRYIWLNDPDGMRVEFWLRLA